MTCRRRTEIRYIICSTFSYTYTIQENKYPPSAYLTGPLWFIFAPWLKRNTAIEVSPFEQAMTKAEFISCNRDTWKFDYRGLCGIYS